MKKNRKQHKGKVVPEDLMPEESRSTAEEAVRNGTEDIPDRTRKKRGVVRKTLAAIEWLLLAAVIGFSVYAFIMTSRGRAANAFGYSLLNVVTGSMEPTILEDEYVLVKKTDASQLAVGDIIAFYSEAPDVRGKLVIHRIVEITEDGCFIVKGDANSLVDALPVRPDQLQGRFVRKAWFFNWLYSFMNPKKLILLAVIIPLVLVSLYETASLARLVHRAGKQKKAEDEKHREEEVERLKREAVEAYLREQAEKIKQSRAENKS